MIFAGQGNNVIHGDLGNDTIIVPDGGNTVFGGLGADTIDSSGHGSTADYLLIGGEESTAQANTSTTNGSTTTTTNGVGNLDTITGFVTGTDHLVLTGHSNLYVTGSAAHPVNVTATTLGTTAADPTGYNAAYDYAYGNSVSGQTSHFGAFE